MKKIRLAIVAGEQSGDILGANLIQALKHQFPQATFEGIGGELMKSLGFNSLFPLEHLSVMGFWEPLKRLPEILKMRKALKAYFLKNRPDVFIGIDAPDFNLDLEYALKKNGIKTVHYVSPTVWAWRQGRIKKIKTAIHLMLSLFPFEAKIYEENQIPICYVGHPLADKIPLKSDKKQAREALQLPQNRKIVALLPGSRKQELKHLAPPFIETAKWLQQRDPSIQFISACSNLEREDELKKFMKIYDFQDILLYRGQSTTVMAGSDVILLASGTAALEAMLIKRPTLVAYKMSALAFAIAKRLIKVPYIALPNLLAGKCIMPEYIQSQVKPHWMGEQILNYLETSKLTEEIDAEYEKIHHLLKKDASKTAAQAITQLMDHH